jgi:hypothetical protein
MASSELSNFQRFQEILTKRPLTTVPENNNAESESLSKCHASTEPFYQGVWKE